MRLKHHNIIPALQSSIKVLCSMECDEDADTSHIRVLPDACVEVFINYTNTPVGIIENQLHKRSIVTFRMNRPMDVQMRKGSGCLAICFYPGMAYRFFSQAMQDLSNTTTALHELWSALALELEDRIADAPDNEIRAAIAQQYLMKQLSVSKYDRQLEYCIKLIDQAPGGISVNRLVDLAGISQRHLSRKFQRFVVLSPQAYIRVSRFISSLSYLKKHCDLSFTELAYKSGYFDQAHFNRNCMEFSGHSPGEVAKLDHILY